MKVDRMLLTMVLVNVARSSKDDEEYTENLAKAIEDGQVFVTVDP